MSKLPKKIPKERQKRKGKTLRRSREKTKTISLQSLDLPT